MFIHPEGTVKGRKGGFWIFSWYELCFFSSGGVRACVSVQDIILFVFFVRLGCWGEE